MKRPAAESPTKRNRPPKFARLLKDLRSRQQMSQAAVARLADVSPGYLGLIETGARGRRPSLEVVKRLAQAVNANVTEMEVLMRATGHLGPRESLIPSDRPTFAQFVRADRQLSPPQRKLLIRIYESWLGRS